MVAQHQTTTSNFVANIHNGEVNGALHRRVLHQMSRLFYKSIVGVRLIVLKIKLNFVLSHPFVQDTTDNNTNLGAHEAGASASELSDAFLNYAITIMGGFPLPLVDGRTGLQNVTYEASSNINTSDTDSIYNSGSKYPLRRSQRIKLRLSGHSFLLSGCAHVRDQVTRMGGNVVENVTGIVMRRRPNLWLLSEPTCRRRIKCLLAVALGLPMLHYHCLNDLEQGKYPSLYSDELYESWRLPTGLNIFSGRFIFPPRLGHGQLLFQGMKLIVALDEKRKTQEWTCILKAAGASVISAEKSKDCAEHIDAVLIDSLVSVV
jgi:hypothetical protein